MYTELKERLDTCRHVGVISHYRPDGDAIGSTLALGLTLKAMGLQVRMWSEDGVPARYAFLTGAEEIEPLPEALPEETEMLICVDTGDWKRLGDRAAALFADFPCIVNIDHHGTNTHYGHLNVVEGGAAACGFVLYKMLRAWGVPLTRPVADALYVAINTDTGSFQYGSTTPEVMHAAAELMAAGVDVADINRRVYQEKPLSELRVTGEVVNNMVVEEQGMISHYSMTMETKQRMGLGLEDTKDLVDIIRVVSGVKVAVIFEELGDGRIRMSLRSKDERVSVAAVAAQFGGGGHAMAAGIRMRGALADCREQVLEAIRAAVRSLSHD